MHFVLSPFGSAGDVHPMLGLALALRDRGHAVTFLTNEYFQELITRHEFEFVPLGTADAFEASLRHPDLWNPMKGFSHVWRSLIEPAMRPQYERLAELNRPGETIAVVNCFGVGALCAQEKLGIPTVSAHLQPGVIWSEIAPPQMPSSFGPRWMQRIQFNLGLRYFIDPVVCPSLNAFRAELGLPPVRQIARWWHSPWLIACLFPDWFCPPQADWPAPLLQTSFPLWDENQTAALALDVEEFLAAGEPPLAFTPGSANVFGQPFFAAAVEACRRLGRRGMLLTRFAEQIPQSLPPGVQHFAYVPFTPLLPRVAAVVHHGGVGSSAQGLAAGVPQLLMPLAHDQMDNAVRLKRLGVADWLKPKSFRPRQVTAKLRGLLDSPDVAFRCREYANRLTSRDGLTRTAEGLEQHASRHWPGSHPAA